MSIKTKYLQLRIPSTMRDDIKAIADEFQISASDVIRGALLFGLPVFKAMNSIQAEIINRLVVTLKRDASLDSRE